MLGGNISDSALFLGHQPWEISHVKPGYIRLQQHQIAFPLKQISELSTPQYSDRLDQLNRSKFKYISFQPAVINMDLSQVEDEIMNNKESQLIKVSLFKLISMFFSTFSLPSITSRRLKITTWSEDQEIKLFSQKYKSSFIIDTILQNTLNNNNSVKRRLSVVAPSGHQTPL